MGRGTHRSTGADAGAGTGKSLDGTRSDLRIPGENCGGRRGLGAQGSDGNHRDRAAQFLPFAALTGYEDLVSQYVEHHESQRMEHQEAWGAPLEGHHEVQRMIAEADTQVAHSLAGTNGVPLPSDRVYLHVVAETDEAGELYPLEVVWPDGRRFKVVASLLIRELGCWKLGTRLIAWEVTFKHGRRETRRILWWERGRWFVG